MRNTVPLTENRDFKRLYARGRSTVHPCAVVYRMRSKCRDGNRLGITASKKIGNAVERNRARRLIKEAYRLTEPQLPLGWDIVIVARRRTVTSKMPDVAAAIRAAFGIGGQAADPGTARDRDENDKRRQEPDTPQNNGRRGG